MNSQNLKASVSFVGDGTTNKFYFGFDYINKQFVKVQIGNEGQSLTYPSDYTVDDRSVVLKDTPAVGVAIRVYRETSSDRMVEWADGAFIKASQMTLENLQQLHLIEEAQDYPILSSLSRYPDGVNFNALGSRITGVSDPKDPQDVVTKHYMENVQGGFVADNTKILNEAKATLSATKQTQSKAQSNETLSKAWATATESPDNAEDTQSSTGKTQSSRSWALYSEGKAQEAAISEAHAKASETNAKVSETNAKASETNAKASETNAKTSETNAKASETNAKTSETKAKASETNAKTSETNAKTSETNSELSYQNAKKWAEATESPDGAEDAQSSTGKTQSSRTWALEAEDSAKDSATSADESKKWSEVAKTNAIGDHVFTGATDSTDGDTGLVPLPKAGEQGKFLKGNSSWVQIEPLIIAMNPVAYYRDVVWSGSKTTLVTPNKLSVNIGGQGYLMNTQQSLSINDNANWDKADFAIPANRKGKDFYIYVCQGTNYIPKIVLSNNSTVPENYTALTSRKIGGFHCECADVGTISNHPLSGYVAGDILPASVWDLHHRPISAPEGMVFTGRIWVDIYLPSWDGSKLVSEYNNVICDGAGAYPLTGTGFAETFAKINKRLLSYDEMSAVAKGSEEGVNIKNSADPNTTGGHVSTKGRRMISDIGCEDCTGVLWQWLSDLFGRDFKSEWVTDDSTISTNVGGTGVSEPNRGGVWGGSLGRMLFGGLWADGSHCGSRSALVGSRASLGRDDRSARGASEPLIRKT